MKNPLHKEILVQIHDHSGKPERSAFLNGYLGNDHVLYHIRTPTLRTIAKAWAREHKDLWREDFRDVVTSLIQGPSATEKIMAGILLGYSTKPQRHFDPAIFNNWLDHLEGWAEVDAVCTGDFTATQLPADWPRWKKLVTRLSKDSSINKRRASLVLFCSPVSRGKDPRLADAALKNVERLKAEKEVMITKAISWVLRSMIKLYRDDVESYLRDNADSLPKIAVRETMTKLKTGAKNRKSV